MLVSLCKDQLFEPTCYISKEDHLSMIDKADINITGPNYFTDSDESVYYLKRRDSESETNATKCLSLFHFFTFACAELGSL